MKILFQIWNFDSLEHIKDLSGHRGPIFSLTFQLKTNNLYSASQDRSVKVNNWILSWKLTFSTGKFDFSAKNALKIWKFEFFQLKIREKIQFSIEILTISTHFQPKSLHSRCGISTSSDSSTQCTDIRTVSSRLVYCRNSVWQLLVEEIVVRDYGKSRMRVNWYAARRKSAKKSAEKCNFFRLFWALKWA